MLCPVFPVLVEAKVWRRRKRNWTLAWQIKTGGEKSKKQLQWYLNQVQAGFQVFYVVWREGERQKKPGLPRWIYHLNTKRFVTIQRLAKVVRKTASPTEVTKWRNPIARQKKRFAIS